MKKIHKEQSGFTLMEVVLVVVLIGLLSYTFVADFGDSQSALQTDGAAKKLAADLRYARQLALTSGQDIYFYIDSSQNQYYVQWEDGSYVDNPLGSGYFVFSFGSGQFSGTGISGTGLDGGRLDFGTNGEVANGGNSFTGKVTVAALGNDKQVVIYGGTARIAIEEL